VVDHCAFFDAMLHRDDKQHFRCYLCCKHFTAVVSK
jgi:transposase-like protein